MAKLNKVNQNDKRLSELMEIYSVLDEDKLKLVIPLIENAVFIENEMRKLQKIIADEGATDEYQNGNNQFGKKASANLQSYNALVKSYNMINTRLENMMPKVKKDAKSKLEELLNDE